MEGKQTQTVAGELLAQWLQATGRKQGWLARQLGVSPAMVSRWLHGRACPYPRRRCEIEQVTGGVVSATSWGAGCA